MSNLEQLLRQAERRGRHSPSYLSGAGAGVVIALVLLALIVGFGAGLAFDQLHELRFDFGGLRESEPRPWPPISGTAD